MLRRALARSTSALSRPVLATARVQVAVAGAKRRALLHASALRRHATPPPPPPAVGSGLGSDAPHINHSGGNNHNHNHNHNKAGAMRPATASSSSNSSNSSNSASASTGSGVVKLAPLPRTAQEQAALDSIHRQFLAAEQQLRRGEQIGDLEAGYAVTPTERVYANSDTPLAHVAAYGFDYDYTLAQYKTGLKDMIYDLARDHLIEKRGYPKETATLKFDRHFAVRGLHYDKRSGFLLKLDQFGKITAETVLKGRTHVPHKQVTEYYGGLRLTPEYIKANLNMLYDTFCLPESCLLADVTQMFMDRKVDFSPQYLWTDVRDTIEHLHSNGIIHNEIARNPAQYINRNPNVWRYLDRLKRADKKVFLLTNSPYGFVDAGMRYLMADQLANGTCAHWRDLFDIVIVKAKKPFFFERTGRFRKLDPVTGNLSLEGVDQFRRGEVYTEGSLKEFTRLTGVTGHSVLYMGDHILSDLVGPSSTAMWKTAAIIKEIGYEITKMATPEFNYHLHTMLNTERLIRFGQRIDQSSAGDSTAKQLLEQLKTQRNTHRKHLKQMFNPAFGSVFRTTSHRTAFYAELGRCADVYTSSIDNFLHYPMDYCFYVQREYFPHEKKPTPLPTATP